MLQTKIVLLIAVACLMTGCVGGSDRLDEYRETCRGYGYEKGTGDLARCVQTSNMRQQDKDRTDRSDSNKYRETCWRYEAGTADFARCVQASGMR